VNTLTSSVSLLASVVLVVVSEAMLFISILWSVVLSLVAHSIYVMGSTDTLGSSSTGHGVLSTGVAYSNTLTLLNTDLLLTSGVVSIAGMHGMTMKTIVHAMLMMLVVCMLGTVFLLVQCIEYLHLYWCLYSSGVAGLLYVTTGIHGGHVLLGMLLILMYTSQASTYTPYTAASTDTVHGILSIILY